MTGPERRAAGFTLLELLVALTVLGVLTALLSSGLGFGTRVWERERDQLEQWSELQTVQEVVRRLIGQAWPLTLETAGAAGAAAGAAAKTGAFVGSDTAVQFYGPPPAQSLIGGIYQYTLAAEDTPQGTRLVLHWRKRLPERAVRGRPPAGLQAPPRPPADDDRESSSKDVVLVDRIARAEFAYFGAGEEGGKPTWRDRWQDASKMPALVRVVLTFQPGDRRRWPPLLIVPHVTGSIGGE